MDIKTCSCEVYKKRIAELESKLKDTDELLTIAYMCGASGKSNETAQAQAVPDAVTRLLESECKFNGKKTAYENGFESGWNNLRKNILAELTAAPTPAKENE